MTCRTLEDFYYIDAHTFEKRYKETLSDYRTWSELSHSSNAAAESFNAKVKAFRTALRGIRDEKFFLYRLSIIYVYPH